MKKRRSSKATSRKPGRSRASPTRKPGEPRGNVQRQTYDVLKERIVLRELSPGTMVSELMLSEQMGIGRAPIRWALQRLALEGLVEVIPQRGVMVTDIDVTKQLKLLEVRAELERLMVKAAARRATPAQRQTMRTLATTFREIAAAGDGRKFMDTLKAVHDLTAQAADNEILDQVIGQVQGLSRRFWYAHFERHGNPALAADLHARRLEAIADGDEQAAATVSDRLVDYLEAFTRATLAYGAADDRARP